MGWVEKTPQLDLCAPVVVINKNEITCVFTFLSTEKKEEEEEEKEEIWR